MKRSTPVLLVLSLSTCTGVEREPTPPVVKEVDPAPGGAATPGPKTPEPAASAEATPPPSAPREPPRLRVAFEGRCSALRASVIDDQVLVHMRHRKYDPQPPGFGDHLKIFRVEADGRPGEQLPIPPQYTQTSEASLSGIFSFAGRWPDQVYASVWVGSRGDYGTGMIRFDGKAWSGVHPLDPYDQVRGVLKWHQRSIVAIACEGDCERTVMPVIRGAPKGPRTDKLRGCESPWVHEAAAIEEGDFMAIVGCKEGLFAARWKPDQAAGETKRLPDLFGAQGVAYHVEHDGKDTFWLAASSSEKSKLIRSAPGKQEEVELPAGKALVDLAVDRSGAPWVLRSDQLLRREGETWAAEEVQVGSMRQLLGVEQGTPWVVGEALARGGAGEPWQRVEMPNSAFFPDRRLKLEHAEIDRAGDVWLDAELTVFRKEKGGAARYYSSVVTSRPIAQPLRCGEVLDDQEIEDFGPWPAGLTESCQKPLVLLLGQDKWKPGNTYPSYGKALRGAKDVGAPRFVELELDGLRIFGAIVDSAASAQALVARARKAQRWKFPETVCGDDAELARVGVKIHRELVADLQAGKLTEKTAPPP